MQANNIYGELVDGVVNAVVEQIRNKIIILIPPGSSRGEIVKRLVNLQGVEILVYKDLHNKLTKEVIKAIESSSEGFKVDNKDLVDYIKINNKLSSGLERGNKIIVTKSTFEAILIYHKLYEELVNELKVEGKGEKEANGEAKDRLNKHIEIFFPPKHYEENLKQKDKDLYDRSKDVISVNYDNEYILKIWGVKELKGISLKLVENINNQWDYIKEGVEAIRALGPERVGFADRIINIARATGIALGATLGGLVLTTAISALLDSVPSLVSFKEKVSEFLGKLSSPFIKFFTKDSVSKFAEKTIEEIGKKGEPRNNTLGALMSLLKAVMMAKEYMNDDRFETIIDEVASRWGLDVDTFKIFIENLYAIATQRIVTEEKLKNLRTLRDEEFRENLEKLFNEKWSEVRKDIENRLDSIEKEIQKMRNELDALKAMHGIYVQPAHIGFNLENGTFGVEGSEYKFVTSEKIEEYSRDLLERIWRREFVVITGPKGIGKSVLTRYTLAKALERGFYVVYEVKKVEELEKIWYIRNLVFGGSLVIFYDPISPKYYERATTQAPVWGEDIQNIIWELYKKWEEKRKAGIEEAIVIVLSTDVLSNILEFFKKFLKPKHFEKMIKQIRFIDIDLNDEGFLTKIISSYSGSKVDEKFFREIGSLISENYKGGYTLVAKYAGIWLSESVYDANFEEIKKVVKEAVKIGAYATEAFIAQFIVYNIFLKDERKGLLPKFIENLAHSFIIRGKLGPLPPKWVENLLAPLENDIGNIKFNFIKRWFSERHDDIVEEVIENIANCDIRKRLDELKKKTESSFLSPNIENDTQIIEDKFKEVLEQLGKDPIEVFFKSLVNNKEFRDTIGQHKEDFAFAVGVAYTPYLLGISEKNQLTDWITLGGFIPTSVRKFLRSEATAFNDIVEPAEIIKKVFDRCKKERMLDLRSMLSALGAFVISDGKLNTYLEEASILLRFAFGYALIIDIDNLLKNRLMTFIEYLVNREFFEHASMLAFHISLSNPHLGEEILKILGGYEIKYVMFDEVRIKEITLKGNINKLNWLARLYYEMASYEIASGNLHLVLAWISRVGSLMQNKKSCNDVSCLYMKALLGSRLANFLSSIGIIKEAKEWMDEAIDAVKELEKRNDLVKELETWLKYRHIFSEPGEAIKKELLDLKEVVYGWAAEFYLQFNLDTALNLFLSLYAKEGDNLATRLEVSPPDVPKLITYAKVLFLNGRENEAFNILRKNIKSVFLQYNTLASKYVVNYIVSFLAEGMINEAFYKYKEYDVLVRLVPKYYVMLSTLLRIYGFNVGDELEKYRRNLLVEYAQKSLNLRAVAGPLEYLYGIRSENEACWDLINENQNYLCQEILTLLIFKQYEELRKLLIEKRLVENELVQGVVDPLEMLEITASAVNTHATLMGILHFIANNNFELARRLAMYWQKLFEKKDVKVSASLFSELAKSLEKGSCDDNCRRALLKLFYFLI